MDVVHTRGGFPGKARGVEILDVAVLGIEEVENLDAEAQVVAELVADIGVEGSVVDAERTLSSSMSGRGPK